MRSARRGLFTAVVLGLMLVSTIATAVPASAAAFCPVAPFPTRPCGPIHR